ncbi:unnamed protein product [Paramecium pentaurelia]|uniref:Attractin/MKLN-like beta-propeller domain-containing protein n=1 Tax=Paramecium pentaurelia TaxID=43138 RepID=A0A8S1TLI7_9CILI|nr:unnamed protein product [Paramecium pentaurelia]
MSANQTLYNQQCSNSEHRAQITNYCACIDCLRPLCPECIQEHYQYHIQAKTQPAIQSILNTRTNCERKIAKAIEQLRKEYEQCDIQQIFNPDEILNHEISRMNEAKEQMFEIITIFFKQQENLLETKVKENQLKVRNIGGIFQKIETVIEQLEILRNSLLTSSDPFLYFHKACRLDVKSLLDRYKSDLKKSIKSKELDPINVHIDEHKLFNLKNELSKIVIIHTNDIEDSGDNVSVLSKNKDQSINYSIQGHNGPQMNNAQNENIHFLQKQSKQQMSNVGDIDDPLQGTMTNHEFSIVRPNYFQGQLKFLHFMINRSKIMKIADLQTKQWLTLQIDYQVPAFHKSIVTPNGDVYISGGLTDQKDNIKESIIRKYTQDGQIQQIGRLTYPRSSHSMVYCNQAIYFLCGYLDHSKITSSMEKYNIQTQKMELCSPCYKPANQPGCCTFNDRYIYKFGGNDENGQILFIIERYDTFTNKWEHINPKIDSLESSKFLTTFLTSACVQINQTNIYVFGGYEEDDKGVSFSFLLNVGQDKHTIHQVNVRPLLYPEGFWNNQVIIHDHKLYVLQNIEVEGNQIDENNRSLLCFDGYKWNELQYQISY